jgi:hypothetical protein
MSSKGSKDMRYASLEVPWDEDEEAQRNVRMRWFATIMYIVLVLAFTFHPFLFPDMDEGAFVTFYMIVVVGGAILLMVILTRPLMRLPGGDVKVMDGLASEAGVVRKLRPGETYYFRMRFIMILYIMVPTIIFMAVLMLFIPERSAVMIIGVVTVVMVVISLIFINFEVKADMETLSFKFGHFGTTIPLDTITSIRVTKVNALKDYMGQGVRIGPDGTKGYILQGDVGFRVETEKGKNYVVTIPDPEDLVEYVKAAKADGASR